MATIEFKLPNLGENIDAGDVVKLLVSVGDVIDADQAVVEMETGKATVEIPCPHAGKITKILVAEGQTVPIGGSVLELEAEAAAEAPKKPAKAPPPAESKPAPPPAPAPAAEAKPAAAASSPATTNGGPSRSAVVAVAAEVVGGGPAAPAGPSTRRLARQLGVDLNLVAGTGPGGRITPEDIFAAVRQSTAVVSRAGSAFTPAPSLPDGVEGSDNFGRVRRQKMSRTRKTIAANMARTLSIPSVTNFDDADITELERLRKESANSFTSSEVKLTMMAFVMKAAAQALRLHPALNASLDLEAEQIVYKQYVNLGVAVDTDRGLIVPVMRNVDALSIPAIAVALTEMAAKARDNKFTMEDTAGGTFTISNLGAIGGTYSTPIINPPEVAILLVGRSRKLPMVVEGDKIEPRLMMPLSLTYDHRLIDGATAARFLNEVKSLLQTPGRLLLAM